MTYPRLLASDADPGSAEMVSFAADVSRPLLVVGNGPSACFPAYDRIPANPVVFRLDWFFTESHYHFGRHVDAFFHAEPNAGLELKLADEIRSGRYTVDRLLSPLRLQSTRTGEQHGNALLTLGLTEADPWALIAGHPRLARHFMGSMRPSAALQALGFGLAAGFRKIYLSGIDLFEHKDARYGRSLSQETAKAAGHPDRISGHGVDSGHDIDFDLAFAKSCLLEFPDAEIVNLGEQRHLRQLIPPAPRSPAPRSPAVAGDAAAATLATQPTQMQGRPKSHLSISPDDAGGQVVFRTSAGAGTQFALINGRKCGYVTLASGNYHHGARALARSLRQVSDVPLIVMCTPGTNKLALQRSGIECVDVPEIINPVTDRKGVQSRFAATYTKLNAFRLNFLDRAVFIDSDTIVRRSLDDLFERDGFCAVPDAGWGTDNEGFNSGVFGYQPSREVFDDMLNQVARLSSADGGDQGFLNEYITDWTRLPIEYNTTKRIFFAHPGLFNDHDVRVIHYVGAKPWIQHKGNDDYAELNSLWFEYLEDFELRDLLRDWSLKLPGAEKDIAPAPPPEQSKPPSPAAKSGTPAKPPLRQGHRKGRELLGAGDVAGAERIARRNLAENPRSVANLKLLRDVSLKQRRLGDATALGSRVVTLIAANLIAGRATPSGTSGRD
ncbi:glycosyltransferase [Saxibacter everestensis]|uniref:Glycosyltransferase n=1 Tax=Saxibacter everestensis TaxID=2909229 RepID=A0ABY8QV50_9MICO|nr:glycosyltransferase [Brevibacteriaceae bacterium ZFBP1038]